MLSPPLVQPIIYKILTHSSDIVFECIFSGTLIENHIVENIIYNELLIREFDVDVGVVDVREKDTRKQLEVDFVCNQGSKRYYIQSALNLDTPEKTLQESKSLNNIGDSFKKIIVVKDNIKLWRNDDGILIIGIQEFLLNKDSLDL